MYTCHAMILWYIPDSLSVHLTTRGQGAFTHITSCNEHDWLLGHPPLLMLHDGSQYASRVGLKTLHIEPVGHLWLSQGLAVKITHQNDSLSKNM